MSWRRLKASSWRVKPAARSAAWGDLLGGTGGGVVQIGHPQQRGMTVDDGEDVVEIVRHTAGSWPMASIFCDWRSCSSRRRCNGDVAKKAQGEQGLSMHFDERIR